MNLLEPTVKLLVIKSKQIAGCPDFASPYVEHAIGYIEMPKCTDITLDVSEHAALIGYFSHAVQVSKFSAWCQKIKN